MNRSSSRSCKMFLCTFVFIVFAAMTAAQLTAPAVTCPGVFTSQAVRSVNCSNDNEEVDCSQPMPTGTTAILTCNPGYKAGSCDLKTARCSRNGTWTNAEVICEKDCGRQGNAVTALIGGEEVSGGDLPWHIIVYYKPDIGWRYQCSGTLISATHVITPAGCVSKADNTVIPATEFQLAARKLVLYYDTAEPNTQWRNLSTIIRHELFVYDSDQAHDIALLVASSSFELNDFVTPACIDWSGQLPAPTASDVLIAAAVKRGRPDATLPLVASQDHSIILDRASCNASADSDNREYITDDRFCARPVGDETCDDREGAGLMFRHTTLAGSRHYLWGVQSHWLAYTESGECFTNRLDSFTNITQYIPWIKLRAGVI